MPIESYVFQRGLSNLTDFADIIAKSCHLTGNIKVDGTINGTASSADFILNNNASLGYRQQNKLYSVNDITYHNLLPTGWYLECTTAGTSSSSELTISNPAIGDTVTDGTVVWTIIKNDWPNYGITLDCNAADKDGVYVVTDNAENKPFSDLIYSKLITITYNTTTPRIIQILYAFAGKYAGNIYIRGNYGGKWGPWQQQEVIVEKSLEGINQYIKYASGLIVQWGLVIAKANTTSTQINYPIAFISSAVTALAERANTSIINDSAVACLSDYNKNGFTAYYTLVANDLSLRWIAIGY